MTEPNGLLPDDERDIERVLRGSGARPQPPAEVERQVRAGVRAEWLAVVATERLMRRRRVGLALAAGVVFAAVGAWLVAPRMQQSDVVLANVVLTHGELRVANGWAGRWRQVADGEAIRAGQQLMTGSDDRGALLLPSGLSLRLDHGTRIAMRSADRVDIGKGSVYVDAGAEAAGSRQFEIGTPAGAVRHLGTQYEVRLDGPVVSIRVREGRVQLQHQGASIAEGRAGEQLSVGRSGAVTRSATDTYGASWAWVAATAPGFELEGRSLVEFLDWAGRELGQRVAYRSPTIAAEAAAVVLSGSVAGLAPDQALAAVMATTQLRAMALDGQIVITAEAEAAPR